jgi:hypothetical protein
MQLYCCCLSFYLSLSELWGTLPCGASVGKTNEKQKKYTEWSIIVVLNLFSRLPYGKENVIPSVFYVACSMNK